MSSDPSHARSPFDPEPPAPRRVRAAHVAAIAAVGVAALGLMGLKFVTLPDAAAVAAGDALKIEVVAPVEPNPTPGSVMEVGELVDGFHYVAPAPAERVAVYDVAWTGDEDFAPYTPPSGPAGVRRYSSAEADAGPPSEPEALPRERSRRWFGFDNPLPDFGAERRARQARLDALEDQRRDGSDDRAPRRYSSEPSQSREPRDVGRSYNPPRDERPADEVDDGPYGPEVG